MSEIRADKLHNASGDNDSGLDLSTNDQVIIKTADTTAITIDASQNVGIGVSPNVKLHLKADDPTIFLEDNSPDDDRGASIHSAAGDLFLRTGDNLDTGSPTVNAEIVLTDGNNIIFRNNASTEHMRIDSDGIAYFGINSITDTPTFGGVYIQPDRSVGSTNSFPQMFIVHKSTNNHGLILKELGSSGQAIQFRNQSDTNVGAIQTTNTATSYGTSSDYRLKENVDYTFDATTRLKQLKPCRFNFIADETNTLVDGFLAHEVSSIVPEAISGEKDAVDADGNIEPQGIDQSKLVPLLVKTIQELEARITALENS